MFESTKPIYKDQYLMIDELKKRPHNIKTLLGKCFLGFATSDYKICSRQVSKLCKKGIIYKCEIPSNLFHKNVYYNPKKKYYIIIYKTRVGSEIFYTFDYEDLGNGFLKLKEYWVLEKISWHKIEKIRFLNLDNVAKIL